MLLDGLRDVGYCQAQLGQLIGLDPHAHRILAAPQYTGLAYALDAGDGIKDVDSQVVALEILVIGAIGRVQRDQQKRERQFFLDRDSEAFDLFRDARLGFRYAVLYQYIGHVQIGTDLERNRQVHGAVIGVNGLHVDHVLHTVDLLLQRRGD